MVKLKKPLAKSRSGKENHLPWLVEEWVERKKREGKRKRDHRAGQNTGTEKNVSVSLYMSLCMWDIIACCLFWYLLLHRFVEFNIGLSRSLLSLSPNCIMQRQMSSLHADEARFRLCLYAQELVEMKKMETSVNSTIPVAGSVLENQGRAASMPRLNTELQVTAHLYHTRV